MTQDASTVNDYINKHSNGIDGWFFPIDMLLFALIDDWQKRSRVLGDIAEIGVYKGKSLTLLALLAAAGERLYAMDIFPDGLLPLTQKTIGRFISKEKQQQIQYLVEDSANYSVDYLREHITQPLRLLHIDAGHEHHEVLHTLKLLAPFVSLNGVIIMDDYQAREFPGVSSATLEFCYETYNPRFLPFLAGANKMYLAAPPIASLIQKQLVNSLNLTDKCRLTRIKDDLVVIAMSKLPQPSEELIKILNSYNLSTINEAEITALSLKAKELGQQNIWLYPGLATGRSALAPMFVG